MAWQRALTIVRALATYRLPDRPALIADAILIDGDRVHVTSLPEPERRAEGDVGEEHGWAHDSAVQLWKNMVDRQAILRDSPTVSLDAIRVPRDQLYRYMSPEQLMGKSLDEASHVYSIGVIAYELLTKRVPFEGDKGAAGIITAQLKREPQPPSTYAPVPPEIDALVLRCLRKGRSERFATLVQLAGALEQQLTAN